MKFSRKKFFKWLCVVAASPVILFLLLALLVYMPPVQRFAVNLAANKLGEALGADVSVGRVRLTFPLNFELDDTRAVQAGDTLLDVRTLRLGVQLMPLFEGRADVDELTLYMGRVNTKNLISDVAVRGTVERFSVAAHGADWRRERLHLNHVVLGGADLDITLADTAQADTASTPVGWVISLDRAHIARSGLRLAMPGDSMRLAALVGEAELSGGTFDLGKGTYDVRRLTVMESGVRFDLPHEPRKPKGIDPSHLSFTDLYLYIKDVHATDKGVVRADLRKLALKERSGLEVKALGGNLALDERRFRLKGGRLVLPESRLTAEADIDWRSLAEGGEGGSTATIAAALSPADIRTLAAGYVDDDLLARLPKKAAELKVNLSGNLDHAVLESVALNLPGVANVTLSGEARHVMQPHRAGRMKADVAIADARPLLAFAPADVRGMISVPAGTHLTANVDFKGDAYRFKANARSAGGRLSADGSVNTATQRYALKAVAGKFPLGRFVTGLGLGDFSGSASVGGRGFDVFSPRASLKADAAVSRFAYGGYDLSGLKANVHSAGGKMNGTFSADNALLTAAGTFSADLAKRIGVKLRADLPVINLRALNVVSDTLELGAKIAVDATFNRSFTAYETKGSISEIRFTTPVRSSQMKDLDFDLGVSSDTTTALVSAGDLYLRLGAKGEPTRMTNGLTALGEELMRQFEARESNLEAIKRVLPVMDVYLDAGRFNPLAGIARYLGYSFSSAYLNLGSDPRRGLHGEARIGAFNTGALLLDTVWCDILQDTTGVKLEGFVKNYRKYNPHLFKVDLNAFVVPTGAGAAIKFFDKDGEEGVNLGVRADLADEGGIRLQLYPEHPVLAYRRFRVNKDNFIKVSKNLRVEAAVDLLADDGTGVKIYSAPNDSTNDLTVSLNRVNLGELSTVMPYLPAMGGMLSGDVHVTGGTPGHDLSAMLSCAADGFAYDGVPLGNLGLDAIYLPKEGGEHHASAFVSVAEDEVAALEGTYIDKDGGLFEGNANLHDFPLPMLNAFLAGTDVALKGRAAGNISVAGSLDAPQLNGSLNLDSAHIYSDVYGFDFRTDEREVEIENNQLLFDNYNLYSTGKNPLVLNGSLNLKDLANPAMNFNMSAENFELINTKKKAKSMVFGKVYTNYTGTLRGTAENLSIRGQLEVLERTNMTYILKDSPLTVDNRLKDLVQFMSFEDTTAVVAVPVPQMAFDMTLGISISNAARFHCDLSEDGESYADLEGGGDLTFRITESGEMRMTGRFTATQGEMKYQLPVIPLKKFKLDAGSYVEFTGDVMNPTLNIAAKERTKAVVTEADNRQRSVAFDVGVALTKPLNEMGLEFTIEAPEDLSVQNELAAMSKEQRGKAAVTMLATGMYMTDETKMSGSGFKATNALNAFLQSEIQNIAGSALKTLDINLGVESGTSATGTSTTDYSFQFAKRFWGDRISVIVGGKVSTGADAHNSAESFINNISVEYRLDRSATRYVRVFYDRETQDPLEGQLTKTGAGLVLRRKTDRLGELFIFKRKK